MFAPRVLSLAALALPANALLARGTNGATGDARHSQDLAKNPIRKVVTLLQNMAKKVEKEAMTEKELYDKFVCYCKSSGGELNMAIQDNTAKVPQLGTDIEEAQQRVEQLKLSLKKHQTGRSEAKTAIAEATNLREKEKFAYDKEAGDLGSYVKGLDVAVNAIESGMAGSALLQSASQAALLKSAVANADSVTEDDRQAVLSFLEGKSLEEGGYVPKSGEIVGTLKEMRDTFAKELARIDQSEKEAVTNFDELVKAKTKEVKTHGAAIEKKTGRVGELGVSIVSMKNDLTDSEEALIADQNFLKNMDKDCDAKKKEFERRVSIRGEELTAIYDTIKILNDDDALELFKKTLPGGSFLQMRSGVHQLSKRVLALLTRSRQSRGQNVLDGPDLRFLEVALAGSKVNFSKVIKMIDDMIKLLKEEQLDDDHKKEYCAVSLDAAEDKLKDLEGKADDIDTDLEDGKETMKELTEELKQLKKGIKDLDKSVLQATEQRKEENEEYTELMSTNTAAKEILEFAKNRLNKFYNPKQYKAPPKKEEEEDAAAASFLQLNKDKPEAPPKTFEGDYEKKGEQSSGCIAMVDLLIRDLETEMTAAETEEKAAQIAYEGLMDDSAKKRAKDTKLIAVKARSKADTEELLVKNEGELTSTQKELMATKQYEGNLHGECDWLLQYYDLRKTARTEETENLFSAKAILSGADFSLLQSQ